MSDKSPIFLCSSQLTWEGPLPQPMINKIEILSFHKAGEEKAEPWELSSNPNSYSSLPAAPTDNFE